MEKFAAIDFETANGKRSSICSVGIVIVEEGRITDSFYHLIRPRPNFYTYWNTEVHGLTVYDTDKSPDFPEVWAMIAPRIQGIPLVAHNSPFDSGCLVAAHELYQMPYPGYSFYCTWRLSRRIFSGLENYKLHTVSAYCGYDLENHHHALADAEACAHIAVTLMQHRRTETFEQLRECLLKK